MTAFREINYKQDIKEIVALIRANLDTQFSEEFFKWKHIDNPFGKSLGLVAIEDNKIVGLRMFMRWEFSKNNGAVIKALRPVDTVVDKEYRGQGLFKKLTLKGLANFENEYNLIFNTPNINSLPGYLKMGWEKMEKPGFFRIAICNPMRKHVSYNLIESKEINLHKENTPALNNTNRTESYLRWRYKDQKYEIASFKDGTYVFFKKFLFKSFPAIMIFDIKQFKLDTSFYYNSLAIQYKRPLIYYLGNLKDSNRNFLVNFKSKTPVIVYRNDDFNIFEDIIFDLGDVEGIL
ncbi:GNAT family N-acetyltransferase [Salinimicrobium sp. TIG7-5_MAKvit]|uniref:GNAT family N-acetyltransferase n=1 Tax=Salinimicrobium sp. TIG7-5_MAKvit TaxID=3121289 RepID=UPI003C6DF280